MSISDGGRGHGAARARALAWMGRRAPGRVRWFFAMMDMEKPICLRLAARR